jgi:hypothetical protein
MAAIPGSVPITGFVAPTDSLDTFASHDEAYGRGGYRTVSNLTESDAIYADRRKVGMLVNVAGTMYQLGAGLTNNDWAEVTLGGGSSTATNVLSLEAGENITLGAPVKVVLNKVYTAHASTDPLVIGLARDSVNVGLLASVQTYGNLTLGNLTPGVPYFVGEGTITPTAPSSGYVIRVGSSVTEDTLLLNIEEPIFLS